MKLTHFFTFLFLLILSGGIFYAKGENQIKTNIEGHWNYPKYSVQPIYVVSEGEDVELFINGISFGHGKLEKDSLYRFDNVIFMPGDLTAVSYDGEGKELSRHTLQTAGMPAQLKLSVTPNNNVFRANGEDSAIIQFEIADFQGKRCGADNRFVNIEIDGPAEWLGNDNNGGNEISSEKKIKVENGTNCALIKSTKTPGEIKVTATAKGIAPVSVILNSTSVE